MWVLWSESPFRTRAPWSSVFEKIKIRTFWFPKIEKKIPGVDITQIYKRAKFQVQIRFILG
jgi:hypothetical protein